MKELVSCMRDRFWLVIANVSVIKKIIFRLPNGYNSDAYKLTYYGMG